MLLKGQCEETYSSETTVIKISGKGPVDSKKSISVDKPLSSQNIYTFIYDGYK